MFLILFIIIYTSIHQFVSSKEKVFCKSFLYFCKMKQNVPFKSRRYSSRCNVTKHEVLFLEEGESCPTMFLFFWQSQNILVSRQLHLEIGNKTGKFFIYHCCMPETLNSRLWSLEKSLCKRINKKSSSIFFVATKALTKAGATQLLMFTWCYISDNPAKPPLCIYFQRALGPWFELPEFDWLWLQNPQYHIPPLRSAICVTLPAAKQRSRGHCLFFFVRKKKRKKKKHCVTANSRTSGLLVLEHHDSRHPPPSFQNKQLLWPDCALSTGTESCIVASIVCPRWHSPRCMYSVHSPARLCCGKQTLKRHVVGLSDNRKPQQLSKALLQRL